MTSPNDRRLSKGECLMEDWNKLKNALAALAVAVTTGFFVWLANGMVEVKSSIDVLIATIATTSQANNARLDALEKDHMFVRGRQDDVRERLNALEAVFGKHSQPKP